MFQSFARLDRKTIIKSCCPIGKTGRKGKTMIRKKENTINSFMEILKKSWTWGKLTEEEKARFCAFVRNEKIRGKKALYAHYKVFLSGCGYKPIGWRCNEECPEF